METLKKHLSDTLSPVVLSHNDLLTKNIVYNLPEGEGPSARLENY
jgi:thiamine kinase-like enzyme